MSKLLVNNIETDVLNNASSKASKKAYNKFQKLKNFGTEHCDTAMRCGKYGIPLLKPYYGPLPKYYVSISNPSTPDVMSTCLTCFDYDYVLERIWYQPEKYDELFMKYMCFGTLDFSMKVDDPLAVQIANKYRNHALSYRIQELGVQHLPVIGWSSRQSFEFCFQGFSKGGAVMVSTQGVLRDERSRWYFEIGFLEMLKQIDPDVVIIYGDGCREQFPWIPATLNVEFVMSNRLKRIRNNGR